MDAKGKAGISENYSNSNTKPDLWSIEDKLKMFLFPFNTNCIDQTPVHSWFHRIKKCYYFFFFFLPFLPFFFFFFQPNPRLKYASCTLWLISWRFSRAASLNKKLRLLIVFRMSRKPFRYNRVTIVSELRFETSNWMQAESQFAFKIKRFVQN